MIADKYLVIYSSEARRDLKRIKDYITKILLAPQAALNQTKRIRDTIRTLEFMPKNLL